MGVGWVYRLEAGQGVSIFPILKSYYLLLAHEISEICDSVVLVADELRLGLVANILLSVDVRDDGRDLTI